MNTFLDVAFLLNSFSNPYVFGATIAFSALLLSLLRRSYGLSFFVTIGLTFAATQIIKSLFHIARPADALVQLSSYRFPSMHASIAAAILTNLTWHWYWKIQSRAGRLLLFAGAIALTSFVSATRLALGVHEVIDVVAGTLLGVGISLLFLMLMRKYHWE